MTTASDYYEVLQVSPNADGEVIQAAYRRLAMKWHPDRNPGDPFAVSQMKLLNEAFGVLSDSTKRREYDWGRRAGTSGGTDKDVPKAKASAPPEPEPAAPPKPRASSPASVDGWSRVVPDAPAIFIAGGVLFLIGHYDILSGNSPAGSLAFLLTCFIWGVLFGTPAYLCFQAKKRTAASVVAALFLLAAGFDVLMAAYNRSEINNLPREPRPIPAVLSSQPSGYTETTAKKNAGPLDFLFHPPKLEQRSAEEIIQRAHFAGRSAEEIVEELRSAGHKPSKDFVQQHKLQQARRLLPPEGESQFQYLVRRAIPVSSAAGNSRRIDRYKSALERFNAGKATQEDIVVIALFEWQQEIDGHTANPSSR